MICIYIVIFLHFVCVTNYWWALGTIGNSPPGSIVVNSWYGILESAWPIQSFIPLVLLLWYDIIWCSYIAYMLRSPNNHNIILLCFSFLSRETHFQCPSRFTLFQCVFFDLDCSDPFNFYLKVTTSSNACKMGLLDLWNMIFSRENTVHCITLTFPDVFFNLDSSNPTLSLASFSSSSTVETRTSFCSLRSLT